MELHTIHLFINNHPTWVCSLTHGWVPLMHNGGVVRPMTQARLCCSGSKGIDGERYQAGPGSSRQAVGWGADPPGKVQRHNVLWGSSMAWVVPALPHMHAVHNPKPATAAGHVTFTQHPPCPSKAMCWPRPDNSSPQVQIQPTGHLCSRTLGLFHSTAFTCLITAMTMALTPPTLQVIFRINDSICSAAPYETGAESIETDYSFLGLHVPSPL